jgi:uncharacterized protein
MQPMSNPFEYGITVTGASFCNRRQELADLTRAMENSERIFLYSERRLGKTSLVLHVLRNLDRDRFIVVYVDLWATDGETSFATATAKAITQATGMTAERLLEIAKRLFSRLSPSVTLDAEGKPKVAFGVGTAVQPQQDIEEVLAAPAKLAAETGLKFVMVFDEVQRILEYEDDHVERLLRSVIQQQTNVGYIFLGSQKHLVQEMFLKQSRPLYRSAGHYPIAPINVEHWRPFIREKFEKADKRIDDQMIDQICQLTEGHPFYTQHLCHALWERCEPGHQVTEAAIKHGLQTLLARESYAYTALWESLALNQRRLLKGLALERTSAAPFSSAFAMRYGLGTSSNVQRAATSLVKRDLIDREDRGFTVIDRFFRLWIREREES